VDSSSSTPASKMKKLTPRLVESDDGSDEEPLKSVAKKPAQSSEQTSTWKIDRLKASLQKPSSEPPQDKESGAEPAVKKLSSKDSNRKAAVDEERAKDNVVRKEEARHDREKHDKKLTATESSSRLSSETQAEDRLHKDASRKSKPKEHSSLSRPPEKGHRTDSKQRPGFVIPKLKKPAETAPLSGTSTTTDTWSDMLKRGAELERNRPKQTAANTAGMRRIPKVVPKGALCGKEDVGVLDKIEQHPGFLRWQQQSASQKRSPKSEDKRNSAAAKSIDDRSPSQPSSMGAVQQAYSTTDNKRPKPLSVAATLAQLAAGESTDNVNSRQQSSVVPVNKRPKPLSIAATLAQLQAPASDDMWNSSAAESIDDWSPGQQSPMGPVKRPPKPLSVAATLAQLAAGDDSSSRRQSSVDPANKPPKPLSIAATLAQLQNKDSSAAVQTIDDRSPRRQSSVKQTYPVVDNKRPKPLSIGATLAQLAAGEGADDRSSRQQSSMHPVQPLMTSFSETASQLPSATALESFLALSPTATKSLLPPSSRKKVLLPTPDDATLSSSTGAAPIPVLMGRGATPSRGRLSSSPTNDDNDHFVQDEAASHSG